MQEETEVLGENLRGQVWIKNQIHIRLWPDWESNPGRIGERHGPLRQPARPMLLKQLDLRGFHLVKEFAYELSVSFTDILNCSYTEGMVPHQWKKAIVIPIPKQYPANIDKLRPVSLADCFAKISEGFVVDWILDDIERKIDINQYGNVKGCGMGPWLVLVSPCFRENVVATCKIGSFLCSLDNLLQKNVIVLFFGNQISKWCSYEKRAIFDLLFTFFSHQGKVTKIPSAHISLTYIHVFCSPY